MSFDFFPEEQAQTLTKAARMPSLYPEAGFFEGTGKTMMQGFAMTARSIDLLGSIGPIIEDKLSGGTTEQDKYFQEHDDVFNRAVDYWTPRPGEVGTAGRIVGSLAAALPTAMLSPALLAIGVGAGTAEDLTRQNVDLSKAIGAGLVSGAATGLGINLPFLGKTLAAKIATGAAGNVALGVGERAGIQKILEGTEAGKQYNPWDKESIVLDTLMGAGFGVLAHITTPSDRAAILTANQARHIEDTTAPGVPVDAHAQTVHADAVKRGIDDLLNGRAANVEQVLQGVEFRDNDAKVAAQQAVMTGVRDGAKEIVPPESEINAPEPPPAFKPVDDGKPPIALPDGAQAKPIDPVIAEAQSRIAANPDLVVHAGTDADGKAITRPLSEVMKAASDDVVKAKSESNLFAEAAKCLLGAL